MRSRRPSQEHSDAVARRVAELSAQLAASRTSSAAGELDDTAERPMVLDRASGDDWWSDYTRVAVRPPLSVVPPVVDRPPAAPASPRAPDSPAGGEPSRLPVPGRHAHRRSLVRAPDLVPAALQGRVRLGPSQLTAVAVLVAVGLALTCWWVVRGDPEPPSPVALQQPQVSGGAPLVVAEEGSPEGAPGATGSTAAAPKTAAEPVTVDVAGKVRRPGIVVLDAGARVVDAVERAGGARPGVDLTSLNLARLLVDGEQILVGLGTTGGAAPAPVPPAGGAATPIALVDLNLADQAQLETLPQVGPVTASAIIAWRTEHGAFTAITELLEVDGIGEATLAQVSPYVTV